MFYRRGDSLDYRLESDIMRDDVMNFDVKYLYLITGEHDDEGSKGHNGGFANVDFRF